MPTRCKQITNPNTMMRCGRVLFDGRPTCGCDSPHGEADLLFGHSDAFKSPSWRAYRAFLLAVLTYYATDILWCVLESNRMATALCVDTSVYFVAMAAGVQLWTKYTVTYLNEQDAFGRFLLHSGRALAAAVGLLVAVNHQGERPCDDRARRRVRAGVPTRPCTSKSSS